MSEGIFFKGGRAATVVRAEIEADLSPEHAWTSRLEGAGFVVDVKDDTWGSVTAALDPPGADDAVLVSVFGHECSQKDGRPTTAHWIISAKPRPANEPPEHVVQGTTRFGGGHGMLAALGAAWPTGEKTPDWSFTIDYILDDDKWESTFASMPLPSRLSVGDDGVTLRPDFVVWRAENHSLITDIMIMLGDPPGGYIISVRGNSGLSVGPSMISSLDKSVWKSLLPLLTPSRQS